MASGVVYEAHPKELKAYIKEKIDILEKHFYLKLTDQEKRHFKDLKTISDVDHYAFTLIEKKL